MKGLHTLWQRDQLAIVRGVGYPKPDRSHFRSMAIWQTALTGDGAVTTGWLGRWLDATTTDPLLALSLDPLLPPMLAGDTIAAASLAGRRSRRSRRRAGPAAVPARPARRRATGPGRRRAAKSIADLESAQRRSARAGGRRGEPDGTRRATRGRPRAPRPAVRAGSRRQLDLVATLDRDWACRPGSTRCPWAASTPTPTSGAPRSGCSTELDTALSRFQARLRRTDRGRQVVTAVYSEFGRRVAANGSDGTDHGTAGPMFVLGRGWPAGSTAPSRA